ncbi:HAMP domain-containing sensor histidine kinase [Kibdelosporangium persicum]|uniref:histidine kinase n=1 Tax=Kibdelosporangium persicum TaxID=2698649 RepID=A0ABX2FDH3_9PSEU|nr:HAMP domain-containing sensor histidine kinase [Kibdelosporangium persicum]NRN68911.1 Integral membrane sensor signal transduction histidine kinase [Kibdelosporangium persicum]
MTTGSRLPARVRIMGWLVLLMLSALTTVILVVREYQLREIDDRVNRSLEQDAEEFRIYAGTGVNPVTGQMYDHQHELIEAYLRGQYTDTAEVLIGVPDSAGPLDEKVQGHPSVTSIPLDDGLLRSIMHDPGTTGTAMTPGGEMRWVKVGVLAANAPEGAQPTAWLIAGYFMDQVRAVVTSTLRTLVVVSLIGLVLTAGASWLIAGWILAPVRTVRAAAAELTEQDLTKRIPVQGRDDIAALAEQFNAMLDRLEHAFATRRQFLDDAGHELRTPITIIRGHLELMGDDPAERAEVIRLCTDELDRMARMVDDLLLLAKAEQPDFVRFASTSVPELTSDIDAKVRAMADRRWTLENLGEGDAMLDGHRVTQAMVQLAHNAVQHTKPGDEIRIGSALTGSQVFFWVGDTGPGVPESDRDRIFERFARGTNQTRDGAGLGLAIVKAIADAHNGEVSVHTSPGGGARFVMELPR